MNEQQASWLVKEMKGAALSCFVYLLLTRRPIGVVALGRRTGWSRWKVKEGLAVLAEMRLATSTGRTNSWQLTDQGYQLDLVDGENLTLASSSSLISDGLDSNNGHEPEEQLQLPMVKKSPSRVELAPEAEELAKLLVERCSCRPAAARAAIARAVAKGDRTLLRIRYDIIKWLAYCLSDKGKGIKSVGYFIAAQIGDGVPAPSWFTGSAFKFEMELRDLEIEMGKEGGAGWL